MKPGEAKVGQVVRLKDALTNYDLPAGTEATIVEVVAQNAGAQADSVLIHPRSWNRKLTCPVTTASLELV